MTHLEDYDYIGTACLGDVKYDDGFDKWDDIKKVIKNKKEIIIKPNHESKDIVGRVKFFELCDKNKELKIGINRKDLSVGLDAFNGVSPQFLTNDKGKIVDITHFAIGNSFKPKCDKSVCYIEKNRGKQKKMDDLEKKIEDLKAENKKLKAKYLELENKMLETDNKAFEEFLKEKNNNNKSKDKDKDGSNPKDKDKDKDLDLTPNQDIEQDIETKPKNKFEYKGFLGNTTKNTENLIAKRKIK